jgi:large subunit ribosomal protein L24
VAHQLRGVARFGPDEIAFDEVTGEFANGRLEGRLTFGSGPTGLSARVRVALNGVEAGAMFLEGEQPPVAGRLTLQAELAGSGRSPAALFGSLSGTGNIRIEGGQLAGLNPGVFDAVVRAAELGMPTEGRRLREFTTGVLDGASLKLSKAEAGINVAAGQARFSNVVLRTAGADLEVTANLDLATATLDALFTLTGLPASAGAVRPMLLVALRGELPALERTVDTSLLASWLTLRAVEQQSQQIDALEKARGQSTPLLPLDSKPAPPEVTSSTPREGLSDRAPPLPPPVNVPAIPQPAGAPRAESAPPRAPSTPAPTTVGPPS